MLDERPLVAVKNIGEEVEVRCFEIDEVITRTGQIASAFNIRGEVCYLILYSGGRLHGDVRPHSQIPGTDDYLKIRALKVLEALHRRLNKLPPGERPRERMVFPDRLDRVIKEIQRCRGYIQALRKKS